MTTYIAVPRRMQCRRSITGFSTYLTPARTAIDSFSKLLNVKVLFHKGYGVLEIKIAWSDWPKRWQRPVKVYQKKL